MCPAVAICASPFIYAESYMTREQAGEILFPGESMTDKSFDLTKDQMKQISRAAGVRVRSERVNVLQAGKGGWLFFDSVVGKHEFIDYAMGISSDGAVVGVEILEYRETYGHQVKDPKWRAQFAGKTTANPLELDKDIQNISGATLSSNNITKGVRRLLHTWQITIKDMAQ
jgi:Na+-translocating ferredoxin:NAD+ oxidoreductase RnfG subunit